MDAGNQSHVVAFTLDLSEIFCISANIFGASRFFAQAVVFSCVSQILHRQLTLLCSLIFSIVSGATFISCRMIWLCCLQEFGRLPSHPSAACRGWEEKRGGQVAGVLVETCTPCHSRVRPSCCSSTTGELVGFRQCHRW